MKLTNLINLMTLAATLAMAGAGCRKTTLGPTTITGQKPPPGNTGMLPPETQGARTGYNPNAGINPNPTPIHTTVAPGGGELTGVGDDWPVDPSDPLGPQTVYFDYDKSAIKASEQSKLQAVASYLQSHPSVHLRVEGNCDERGTEEYNRSLGERRALAAREHLAQMGIDPNRIVTVTYGEDRPADPGHNESAWAKNRRDDFKVLLPPR